MRVPYGEGRAYRTGPESCVAAREGRREALTGEHAGQVLSYVTKSVRSADTFLAVAGDTEGRVIASARPAPRSLRPWRVCEAPRTGTERSRGRPSSYGRPASGRPEG